MQSFKDALGNKTWNFLHFIVLGFPNDPSSEESNYWFDFIINLSKIYPCQKCQIHFEKYVNNNPPFFENNTQAVNYFRDFHNSVNYRLNKPIYTFKD